MEDIEEITELKAKGWLPENFKLSKDIEKIINNYEQNGYKGTPAKEDIFNAFKIGDNGEIIKPEDVRILILGQDPYPNAERAHGLAFSFGDNKIPADDSLLNIFKAIKVYKDKDNTKRYFCDITDDEVNWETNLEIWAKNNGILLLNTALTYEKYCNDLKNKKDIEKEQKKLCTKHQNAWKPFVKQIFFNLINSKIQNKGKNLAVFLWGVEAQDIFFESLNDIKDPSFWKISDNFLKEIKYKNKERFKKVDSLKHEKIFLYKNSIRLYLTSHPSNNYNAVKNGFCHEVPKHFADCDKFLFETDEDKYIWKNFPDNNKKQ